MNEQSGASEVAGLKSGDAVTRPPGAGSSLEGSVSPKKKTRRRRLPPQSEIAQIDYWWLTVERKVEKTIVKSPFWIDPTKETITETIQEKRYQFYARAVGPEGVYIAGESPTFEGQIAHVSRSRYSGYDYVVRDDDSGDALNALLSQLWSEGWQPTSWGQSWYDFRLRRAVLNSERSSPRVSSPRVENSDSRPSADANSTIADEAEASDGDERHKSVTASQTESNDTPLNLGDTHVTMRDVQLYAAMGTLFGSGSYPDMTKRPRLIPPGAKLTILEFLGDWVKVRTEDGRTGWVTRDGSPAS